MVFAVLPRALEHYLRTAQGCEPLRVYQLGARVGGYGRVALLL